MIDCSGDGSCLIQTNPYEYVSNPCYVCSHNCQPVECPNYLVCDNHCLKWTIDCHNGKCVDCTVNRLGVLIRCTVDCPVCLEKKLGVIQPRCEHCLCAECFNKCYFEPHVGETSEGPLFPFPDIEDDYRKDPNNDTWLPYLPFIEMYESARITWEDEEVWRKFQLARCPICRQR